jgi:hypothetical protein
VASLTVSVDSFDVSVVELSVSVMVRHESDSVAFHLSSLTNMPLALVSRCSPCASSPILQLVGGPGCIPIIYSVCQHRQEPLAPACVCVCMSSIIFKISS